MKRSFFVFLAATCLVPFTVSAQGGYGGRSMGPMSQYRPSAPKLPGVELTGPLDTASARAVLSLNDSQARRYTQVYDSFMVATRPQRDTANDEIAKMNSQLDQGDRAAAMFYVDHIQDLGKYLRDRQDRFEDNLRRFLSGDQVKAYKKWKDSADQANERKQRENEIRWAEAAFRGENGGTRAGPTQEIKTALPAAAGVAPPALGSQSVRIGRTVYVTGQLGVDSSGALVGTDLRAQAERAFVNLTTVLVAAGTTSRDVTSLTIYVVNYRPADLATIRDAGVAYFGTNAPAVTILGVQSLGRDGALITVSATATARL